MEKVIRDGEVAVLYSPGYGAGWYSWNKDHAACLFHPKVVEMVEAGRQKEITDEFMEQLLGVEYFYAGGAVDLRIKWLPIGTAFTISDYDGNESVQTSSELMIIA